jgi:hypothetical protein
MGAGVLLDFHEMEAGQMVGRSSEGASAESARARDRIYFIQMRDLEVGHGWRLARKRLGRQPNAWVLKGGANSGYGAGY